MSEIDNVVRDIGLIVLGACAGACIAVYTVGPILRDRETEAIARGFAEWKSDENGRPTFVWRESNAKQD